MSQNLKPSTRNKIIELLDEIGGDGRSCKCEQNTEVLKEILGCVKSIHTLLKRQAPDASFPNNHSVSVKRIKLADNANISKVYMKESEYEQFEDVNFLDEELINDATKLEEEEEAEEKPVLISGSLQFPLKTIEEVDILEAYLQDPKSSYRRKIIDLMIGTGFESKDYKYAIRAFFRMVYDRTLISNYCWHGTETKLSLKNLTNTLGFFESTVRKWAPSWKKDDFGLVVRNYIRNCPGQVITKPE